jgi:biopolymer transport protein ExbB|tara:strand:- start:6305 stop:6952 length:648 start_codon:yes stop_codon:yes gene_type:complete
MVDTGIDDLTSLINRGGIVMIPLFVLSVISLTLILERVWFWLLMGGRGNLRRLEKMNIAFRSGDKETVRKLTRRDGSPYGEVANALISQGASDAVALEAVERQRPRLDRFMVALSTIITAAPLLGILGTVMGIIASFRLLGDQATLTDPSDVAGGIAAALLTTALGLIVALVTLFPYMLFRGWASQTIGRLEMIIAAAQQGISHEEANSKKGNES